MFITFMSKKILVIEDSPSIVALLVSQLQQAGFETIGAPDAMLGIKECVRWRPDLVVLDLMLPAGGGVAVLRSMKQSIYLRTTPVIVLTGSQDPHVQKQILEFGIKDFIQKPHNKEELLARINKALGLPTPPPPSNV
jgi:DNA-binding response OmpR family regulator